MSDPGFYFGRAAAVAVAESEGNGSYGCGPTAATTSSHSFRASPITPFRKIGAAPLSTQASTPSTPREPIIDSPLARPAGHSQQSRPWSRETSAALDLLRSQDKYYAIVELKSRPYYVNLNDVLITMRMNELELGDIIQLDRVREIGSRDFVLKGNPYVDPSYFTIKAVAIEHPVSREIKTIHKKRRGRDRVAFNHSHHTALRIATIKINDQ
ncbi:uncharacterized protein EV422DRAFT_283458 [Fimicolochytrium jonesii]|uniref:uncharacterized protein n=1 Tax=Fimicolochytrium jonesii TaxID=1396493 RepID=UPI0022FE0E02|nr:uncharacterized protein EV422DRAFT_283458 [Fimicolochytrium jonesii]KAI8816466.1 hypothetical protein EV422DRAFT_283458 [Fimicolochytrium jonesii]